jgi:hypothetical protein
VECGWDLVSVVASGACVLWPGVGCGRMIRGGARRGFGRGVAVLCVLLRRTITMREHHQEHSFNFVVAL